MNIVIAIVFVFEVRILDFFSLKALSKSTTPGRIVILAVREAIVYSLIVIFLYSEGLL